MALIHLLFFGAFSTVLCHSPCIDYRDVCVPAEAMRRRCHCVLIRPGQETSARQTLRHMFGRMTNDQNDGIRFANLSQSGVDELNQFFGGPDFSKAEIAVNGFNLCSEAEAKMAELVDKRLLSRYSTTFYDKAGNIVDCSDRDAFASINSQVHTRLMTVPTNLVNEVINMQADWLSREARQHLAHCAGPRCVVTDEVTDLLGDPSPTRQDRKFRVVRAIRYDLPDDDGRTLIAFATATSDVVLNKKLEKWTETVCKMMFYKNKKKKCKTTQYQEEYLREFDEKKRKIWMNHVILEMIDQFRIGNANMLV